MNDTNDELERYRQLLGDWDKAKTGPESRVQIPKPTLKPRSQKPKGRARLQPQAPDEAADGRYQKGTILVLDEEELAIYRRPVAGKPYDMVYSLMGDGGVKIEAVDLPKHEVTELGQLSAESLKILQNEMRWSKPLIAPHCHDPADADRLPDPENGDEEAYPPPAATSTNPPVNKPNNGSSPSIEQFVRHESATRVEKPGKQGKTRIGRGQHIKIQIGGKSWEAVYWGKDQTGTVVAHKTHAHWVLMHLDLGRYKDSLVVVSGRNESLIEEISLDLKTQHKAPSA